MSNFGQAPPGVLKYLREMIDYCRLEHRPELVAEYEEAWRLAAQKLYGPLPDRWLMYCRRQPVRLPSCPEQPKADPLWKKAMLAKPLRKVVRTFTQTRDSDLPGRSTPIVDRYLELECGHILLDASLAENDPPAKRRRCGDCALAGEKKRASSVPSNRKGKTATA